ncbi:hypothetical protein D3C84_944110 [compost metagenome]
MGISVLNTRSSARLVKSTRVVTSRPSSCCSTRSTSPTICARRDEPEMGVTGSGWLLRETKKRVPPMLRSCSSTR